MTTALHINLRFMEDVTSSIPSPGITLSIQTQNTLYLCTKEQDIMLYFFKIKKQSLDMSF